MTTFQTLNPPAKRASGIMIYPSVLAALRDGVRIFSNRPNADGLLEGDVRLASGKLGLCLIQPCEVR